MLFHNQTFEERLKFFELNLCDYPVELTEKYIHNANLGQVISGLKELRQLFTEVYTAVDVFQEEDALESLHNLTNTIMLLYSLGLVGKICRQGEKWYLQVDKKHLKIHYKQSLSNPMEKLQKFSFCFEYYKKDTHVDSLNKCTYFTLNCEKKDNVLLALNYILQQNFLDMTNEDYTRMQGLFYKLDYRSILLKESTKRTEINPLRKDILKSAGFNSEFFVRLLERILSKYPLRTKIKLHEYFTPHWIMQFYTINSDKFAFNINIAADTVCLEIRLSIETIVALAARTSEITGQLKREFHKFGCISCNIQCETENLKDTNGIYYCSRYSEARLLTLYISSEEDVLSALLVLNYENLNSKW